MEKNRTDVRMTQEDVPKPLIGIFMEMDHRFKHERNQPQEKETLESSSWRTPRRTLSPFLSIVGQCSVPFTLVGTSGGARGRADW